MRRPVGLAFLFLTLFSPVSAQTETSPEARVPEAQVVVRFLTAVQNHPAVRAQAALVAAARAQLEAVYAPVTFNASANYTRLNLDIPEPPPGEESPNNLVGLNLGASFRPFVFGDTADLARSRQIDLAKAELGYTETLSALQTQALGAAAQVAVAEASLSLADEGRAFTEEALTATRLRQTKGAAAESEVRALELQLREADNRLLSAQTNLSLAKRGLANLVGTVEALGLVRLEPTRGTPPEVQRAALDLALAQVGVAGTGRALYPTRKRATPGRWATIKASWPCPWSRARCNPA